MAGLPVTSVSTLCALIALIAPPIWAGTHASHVVVTPADLQWADVPSLPPGAKIARGAQERFELLERRLRGWTIQQHLISDVVHRLLGESDETLHAEDMPVTLLPSVHGGGRVCCDAVIGRSVRVISLNLRHSVNGESCVDSSGESSLAHDLRALWRQADAAMTQRWRRGGLDDDGHMIEQDPDPAAMFHAFQPCLVAGGEGHDPCASTTYVLLPPNALGHCAQASPADSTSAAMVTNVPVMVLPSSEVSSDVWASREQARGRAPAAGATAAVIPEHRNG